jgi:hypothetical protein
VLESESSDTLDVKEVFQFVGIQRFVKRIAFCVANGAELVEVGDLPAVSLGRAVDDDKPFRALDAASWYARQAMPISEDNSYRVNLARRWLLGDELRKPLITARRAVLDGLAGFDGSRWHFSD